jgi:hypothetical protein
VTRAELEEYLGRPWSELEDSRRRFWAERYAAEGPAATLAASRVLWQRMKAVRPEWPDEAERAADFEHHVRLKALLDRTADVDAAR